MTKFTIADFNKGYWMVELDPRIKEIHNDGFGHWKIPVDKTSNTPMIKPHFELWAEAQPWNFEGKSNSHSSDSFNPMTVESMLPVTPMGSVTPPATTDRASKVGKPNNPITSTEAPQPAVSGVTPSVPMTPRCSTRSTKGVPPVRYTPSKK